MEMKQRGTMNSLEDDTELIFFLDNSLRLWGPYLTSLHVFFQWKDYFEGLVQNFVYLVFTLFAL